MFLFGKRLSISKIRLAQVSSFAFSFAALILMSDELFHWLRHSVFNEPREDMEHGWFVPLFSLFLIWLKRNELKAASGMPSLIGLVLALFSLCIFAFGSYNEQIRITQLGAILLIWAIFYAIWGRGFALTISFPCAFLLFTVPLAFLDIITVKLRMIISAVASVLLNGFGIPVLRTGTGLYCLSGEGFSLDIADPCSGLRSIFALTALTAAYAYLNQKSLRGKWLLFLCAVPVAILGNLVRIFLIAVVARFFGQSAATGFYHDYSGYLTFIIAVIAIVSAGNFLSLKFEVGSLKQAATPSSELKVGSLKLNEDETISTPISDGQDNIFKLQTLNSKLKIKIAYAILILLPAFIFATGKLIKNAL